MNAYRTVKGTGSAEVVIQRSKFLAVCMGVQSAEEAAEQLSAIQKKHWDASHHCYAYALSDSVKRFSDAGEPSGTAGMPILEVLNARSLSRTLVVVTRYFGGVLLGAGRLARTYADSAAQAVDAAGEVLMVPTRRAGMEAPYELLGKIQYLLRTDQAAYEYGANVLVEVWVKTSECEAFESRITEATDGRVRVQWHEEAFRASEEK